MGTHPSAGTAASIEERQDRVIREFEELDDRMETYKHLIGLARNASGLDEAHKDDRHRIHGCQAEAWLRGTVADGRVCFEADSPSLIVKGLATLLIRVLSGSRPDAILAADLYFIERIGLAEHLSPTRSNGLAAMLERMRSFAQAHAQGDAAPSRDAGGG